LEYINTIIYGPAALFVKSALLLMVARVFAPHRHRIRFIYGFILCLFCYYIAVLIAKAVVCTPVSSYWESPPNAAGKCINQRALFITDCVVGLVTDATILVLPLPLVWILHMSRGKKIRIIALLGAGGVATLFSLYRLVILFEPASQDPTRLFVRLAMTGSAEIATGLICSCLPGANMFMTKIIEKGFKWRRDSNSYQNSTHIQNTTPGHSLPSRPEMVRLSSLGTEGFEFEPCPLTTVVSGPPSRRLSGSQEILTDDSEQQVISGIQVNLTMVQTIVNLQETGK
ncbi:hypothetical protein BGW36DRAFT_286982, partial [Talaromyces proteolyticus]